MNPTTSTAAIITLEDQCLAFRDPGNKASDFLAFPRYPFPEGADPDAVLRAGIAGDYGLPVAVRHLFRTSTGEGGKTQFFICRLTGDVAASLQAAYAATPADGKWLAAYELDLYDWPPEETQFLVFLRNFLSADMY